MTCCIGTKVPSFWLSAPGFRGAAVPYACFPDVFAASQRPSERSPAPVLRLTPRDAAGQASQRGSIVDDLYRQHARYLAGVVFRVSCGHGLSTSRRFSKGHAPAGALPGDVPGRALRQCTPKAAVNVARISLLGLVALSVLTSLHAIAAGPPDARSPLSLRLDACLAQSRDSIEQVVSPLPLSSLAER